MDASAVLQTHNSLNESGTDDGVKNSETIPSPAAPPPALASESSEETDVHLSETLQEQGVFQTPQTSVIQARHVQTGQTDNEEKMEDEESEAHRRREVLSRRPSYRKILNELSSESTAASDVKKELTEDKAEVSSTTSIYQTSSGQYTISQGRAVQLNSAGAGSLQEAPALTVASSPTPQPGTAFLQCAAPPADSPQQFYIQGGQVLIQAATGDIPAYQLRSPNSGLAQSFVMAASPGSMESPSSQHTEEVTRKREVRLMKNREAARECRRKKKEYVKCLENRVAVLENQNKTLIEELKALKDIYCHKAE
ncbi:cAMP-responsive element modulator isoform X2 [Gouania willdenowi]|uniref:cAMP-responsive element modulator isoform X2 n=1 Tax=Gouania willdenowi TaxID=441366 RepID=UPI001054FCB5|nr:cAMP-responsive element modulator-like isoform X2 [Gouania willdenowi]